MVELLVMLLLIGAVSALIVGPLVRPARGAPRDRPVPRPPDRARESALAALRELEFDLATGKLSDDDYAALRARYEARAIEALSGSTPQAAASDADARIEAEIAAARQRARCASCGQPLPPAARFCPACGTAAPEVRR